MSDTLIRTPLYDEHVALGARMVDFAGFEMPVQYGGILEEHLATRESVGIFDVSHMAEFRISGEGAFDFLNTMLSNEVNKIVDIGAAQYTLLLNDAGCIIDDLIVYNTGLEFLIISNASNRFQDWNWLYEHKPDNVEMFDETDRTGLIAVQGPKALGVLKQIFGPSWEPPHRFHIEPATIDGKIDVLVARTGYTGEDGVEIIVHKDDVVALWRMLLSFPEVSPVGLGARDTLRLEMGYSLYGSDMDITRDPISAGLGWACPKSKEGYTGCEALKAIRETGPSVRLVHLLVENGIPRHGYSVLHEGKEIGTVGSGSHSPSLGKGMATAYVPAEFAEPGTELEIQIRKRTVSATVVKPPFLVK
ncbi:MAG: glycine cleavage system aminomethyltransferase GcvT [Coriobacteriia bacterium]|nr:glycine cleavage system aminomethyltransferase GcvT [Coriobacteriia bacterium]